MNTAEKKLRICLDLDGVISDFRKDGQSYADVSPIPGAIEKIKQLRANGHYIIIHTARHMKTCNGNVGMVQAKIGKATIDWLEQHNVEYDELHFGKPWANIYIDDNAFRFKGWDEVLEDGSNLPEYNENKYVK
jgi:capsule biosynthesis phosphatase